MPAPVACPVCGADGTAAANAILAQAVTPQPAAAVAVARAQPVAVAVAHAAPAPVAAGVSLATVAATPPPVPSSRPSLPRPAVAAARGPYGPISQAAPKKGRDGWATEETGLNKMGTHITTSPALCAALLAWGSVSVEVPGMILGIVVGVCGVIGGMLNVAGRGPLWAGAIVGPVLGLGGFCAVFWWAQGRQSAYKYELAIAFLLGCAPGMGLQWLVQQMVKKMNQKRVE